VTGTLIILLLWIRPARPEKNLKTAEILTKEPQGPEEAMPKGEDAMVVDEAKCAFTVDHFAEHVNIYSPF